MVLGPSRPCVVVVCYGSHCSTRGRPSRGAACPHQGDSEIHLNVSWMLFCWKHYEWFCAVVCFPIVNKKNFIQLNSIFFIIYKADIRFKHRPSPPTTADGLGDSWTLKTTIKGKHTTAPSVGGYHLCTSTKITLIHFNRFLNDSNISAEVLSLAKRLFHRKRPARAQTWLVNTSENRKRFSSRNIVPCVRILFHHMLTSVYRDYVLFCLSWKMYVWHSF